MHESEGHFFEFGLSAPIDPSIPDDIEQKIIGVHQFDLAVLLISYELPMQVT